MSFLQLINAPTKFDRLPPIDMVIKPEVVSRNLHPAQLNPSLSARRSEPENEPDEHRQGFQTVQDHQPLFVPGARTLPGDHA
jgi:hypothetical protein